MFDSKRLAPLRFAICPVESVEASSTTIISYGSPTFSIVARMLSRHLPIQCSSLWAGTMKESIPV